MKQPECVISPTYRLHIFQNVIMQHSECLFLAHFVSLPLLQGCCQRNTIEGVCCLSLRLSEMCSITPYSHWALNSPPSLILHRCSRRKFFFFFCFKWMSRAWHNTVQRNAQVSTVQKLVMSSLPLSSFSTSQKINMGTIMLAQCLKKTTRKCGGEALTGKFPRLLCAELSGAGWYVQGALPEAILVLLATPKPLREVRSWGNSEGVT